MKTEPNYMAEMLGDANNLNVGLLSAAAAGMLSFWGGWPWALLAILGYATAEAMALIFVPDMPSFRSYVNTNIRERERKALRTHLAEEIANRAPKKGGVASVLVFQQMQERVASLYKMANDSNTKLSHRDVEKLDDTTLNYLSLWLGILVSEDRARSVDSAEVEDRMAKLETRIRSAKTTQERAQLQKAFNDFVELQERHRRMQSRKVAMEAALIAMPDKIEEIYQMMLTSATMDGVGARLDESLRNLMLEEELEEELGAELEDILPGKLAVQQRNSATLRAVTN